MEISVKSNIDQISKQLSHLAYKQLPFATVKTVNQLAKMTQDAEKKAMLSVFDSPTPFTVNSVVVKKAYKTPKAAQYLEPYENGGTQFLGKKPADLVPVQQAANQYGNLPRGILNKYKNRKDCFIGTVKTKRGETYGLWQRPTPAIAIKGIKQRRTANTTGALKLLVAFHKPVTVTKRLNFGARAHQVVNKNFDAVFGKELAKAMATAK